MGVGSRLVKPTYSASVPAKGIGVNLSEAAIGPTRSITDTIAFVDWNTQIRALRLNKHPDQSFASLKTIEYVAKIIANTLSSRDSERRFLVTLRIYHGWLKGFEPTIRRRALRLAEKDLDYNSLGEKRNVKFRPTIELGDRLISAAAIRLHNRLDCHLPNTLRTSLSDEQKDEEKMVDTAIASDVVDVAHREKGTWIVLVSDDDDMVPPAFVAEKARTPNVDGQVVLARRRGGGPFLNLEGLLWQI